MVRPDAVARRKARSEYADALQDPEVEIGSIRQKRHGQDRERSDTQADVNQPKPSTTPRCLVSRNVALEPLLEELSNVPRSEFVEERVDGVSGANRAQNDLFRGASDTDRRLSVSSALGAGCSVESLGTHRMSPLKQSTASLIP